MRIKPILIVIFTLFLLLAVVPAAVAQDNPPRTPTDDEVNAVAKQLYCPVCENTPLDVCPTQACQQWRDLIREQLAQGRTEEQIKMYFVDQYGDRVLAAPPARGFNWLVYVVPPLMILAGVFVLYSAFRSWKKPTSAVSPDQPQNVVAPPDDEYIARMEEELRRR